MKIHSSIFFSLNISIACLKGFAVFEFDYSVERVGILGVLAEITRSDELEFFARLCVKKRFFDLAVFKRLHGIGVEIVVESLSFGDGSCIFDIEQIVVDVHGDVGAFRR